MSLWFTFSETLNVYTWCASLFFVVGACGVMYSSQSFLITAINIELLYLGATLIVIFASIETFSIYPQLFGLLLVVVAACEAVVGLGLLISLYHAQGTIAFQPYAKLFSVFLVSTSLAFTNNCTGTDLQVDRFAWDATVVNVALPVDSVYESLGQSAGASIFIIIGLASIFVAASLFIYLDAGAQSEQRSEYECGFIPLDDGVRSPADIHFYLVGVLFLIFDVEVALLYPWLVADNLLIWQSYSSILLFILALALGFVYEWLSGALDWAILTIKTTNPSTKPLKNLGTTAFLTHELLRDWVFDNTDHYWVWFAIVALLQLLFLGRLYDELDRFNRPLDEIVFILALATIFLTIVTISTNLYIFFLCLIGFSLCSYICLASTTNNARSREASIKYYYISTFASGLILYGTALLLFIIPSGELVELPFIMDAVAQATTKTTNVISVIVPTWLELAQLLFLAGLLIKLAAFPTHAWAPDVYAGSNNSTLLLLATSSKLGLFAFTAHWIALTHWANLSSSVQILLTVAALGSLLVGCFGAIREFNFKKFIAYTSINQMGFLLLGLTCQTWSGLAASLEYLDVYMVTSTALIMLVLGLASYLKVSVTYLSDLSALTRVPTRLFRLLIPCLVIVFFSLAGVPPLAGFFIKLRLFQELQNAELWVSLTLAILCSLISTVYYLRLIQFLVFDVRRKLPESKPERNEWIEKLSVALTNHAINNLIENRIAERRKQIEDREFKIKQLKDLDSGWATIRPTKKLPEGAIWSERSRLGIKISYLELEKDKLNAENEADLNVDVRKRSVGTAIDVSYVVPRSEAEIDVEVSMLVVPWLLGLELFFVTYGFKPTLVLGLDMPEGWPERDGFGFFMITGQDKEIVLRPNNPMYENLLRLRGNALH